MLEVRASLKEVSQQLVVLNKTMSAGFQMLTACMNQATSSILQQPHNMTSGRRLDKCAYKQSIGPVHCAPAHNLRKVCTTFTLSMHLMLTTDRSQSENIYSDFLALPHLRRM